jgi:hypothetical protein
MILNKHITTFNSGGTRWFHHAFLAHTYSRDLRLLSLNRGP